MTANHEASSLLDKLKALEASPGPWKFRVYGGADWDGTDDGFLSFDDLRAADGELVAFGVWCNDSTADLGIHNADTAKLIALAHHIPKLVEELEEALMWAEDADQATGARSVLREIAEGLDA